MEHLILAEEPRCSGLVNLSRQLCSEMGPLPAAAAAALPPLPLPRTVGRSREMSQKGSIVVETFLQDCNRKKLDIKDGTNVEFILNLISVN